MSLDPVTLQVLIGGLRAACDEMGAAWQGRLVGIDVLAPTDVSVVIGLVEDPNQKKAVRKLMRNRLGRSS